MIVHLPPALHFDELGDDVSTVLDISTDSLLLRVHAEGVPEQQLDLLKLPAGRPAHLRT
jgi:hypothetical protein